MSFESHTNTAAGTDDTQVWDHSVCVCVCMSIYYNYYYYNYIYVYVCVCIYVCVREEEEEEGPCVHTYEIYILDNLRLIVYPSSVAFLSVSVISVCQVTPVIMKPLKYQENSLRFRISAKVQAHLLFPHN